MPKNNNSICQFNVFFKISDPLYSEVINISQEINKNYPAKFYLDHKRALPHLSMYLFTTPNKNKEKVIETAKKLTKDLKPANLTARQLIAGSGGYIMLEFERSDEIYNTHCNVVNAFNPLRGGTQRKKYLDKDYFNKLSELNKTYLTKYGHKFVFDRYEPHVSISVLDKKKDQQEVVNKYSQRLVGKKTKIEAFRILEDNYETSGAKQLIYDELI